MFKARSAFIAVLVCGASAAYAIPASATTTIGAPVGDGPSFNCPWGYASGADDLVAHGEIVVAPEADSVLDSFSFYVTQLREGDAFVGEPQDITYKAYVGKWGTDPTDSNLQTVTEPVWDSGADPLTVTTSPDPAQWKTMVQTGGVQLEPGQEYALYFSTLETSGSNTPAQRGCGVHTNANFYEAPGVSLIQYFGGPWTTGVFSADNAFEASFSAPAEATIYDFDGFYAPVNNKDAQDKYVLNAARAGSAIPVKFSLGGDYGLEVFEAGYPRSQAIECNSSAEVDGVEETVTAGSSSLSYAAGSDTYNYVWKTEKAWTDSCRQLVVKFDDDTTARANFMFH